jgi:hypothetical protein
MPRTPSRTTPVRKKQSLQKQALAGLAEMTIADASKEGEVYRPAILYTLPTLLGAVATAIKGKPLANNNVLQRAVNSSMERSALATERTNRTLGTGNPGNTVETFARVVPSLILPGPKGANVARTITRAAPKVGPKVVKAAQKVVTATPKPARAIVRGATELSLPLRQTKTVGGTALAGAVGVGAGDALMEAFDPQYESDVWTSDNAPATGSDEDFLNFIDGDAQAEEVLSPEDQQFLTAVEGEPSVAEADQIEEEEKWLTWENAAITLSGLALGGAALAYGRNKVLNNLTDASEIPTFTGKQYRRSRGGIGNRIDAGLVQQDAPIRSAVDEFLSPAHAAEYKYNSDLINNVSIGTRVAGFFRTGKAPKSNIRSNRLAPVVEAYAKELTPVEQRGLSDALLAESALDDFNRTGVLAALNLDRSGQSVTPATLRATVAAAKANPKYSKYLDAIQRSYQDLLKYKVDRGLITFEQAKELATQRPNYVRMSRDLEKDIPAPEGKPYNANEARGPGWERNTEELQGVQGVTGVGNPFNAVLDDWASAIRQAEVNDLRLTTLERLAVANPQLVKQIPSGVTPNTMEGVQQVYKNGHLLKFRVNDARMSKALEYAPRATIQGLEALRQVAQSTVTGPLGTLVNGFALFKSPIYDTTMGMLLKGGNVKLGLINEALGKINPKLHIGSADPTALVSAYTGMARYAWDDLRGSMAQNLSEQLIKENTWLRSAIGDQNVTALRDRLQASYENSTKALMEEMGISSLTMHGSPDPSAVMSGLESVTPRFTSAMAKQLADDTLEASKNGTVSPLYAKLKQGQSGFARARASSIARVYEHVLEAAHNGFRYSMVAGNISRNPDLVKLASQARRISVDSAQHGGNDAVNKAASGFMYANLTIQSLAAAGKMIVQNPVQFATNAMSLAIPLAAMHYLALATDPEAAEQHANKSAVQKARSVTTFGGAEVPIDPILRLMIGPMFTTLDHMTGAHNNQWDRGILESMSTWLESDQADDDWSQDISDLYKLDSINPTNWGDNLKANVPFAPEAFPAGQAILAGVGVDPGMSRVTGEAVPTRMQGISGFDMDQKRVDGLTSGWTETMIGALGGSFLTNLYGMAEDAYRAYIHPNGGPHEALRNGLARYREGIAKGAAVARPALFDQYEQVAAVTDTNWMIVNEKEKGIKQAITIYDKDVRAGGVATGVDPTSSEFVPTDNEPNQVLGTQNAVIGGLASHLQSTLKPITDKLGILAKQSEGIRNGYLAPQGKKNVAINEIVEQRKYWTMKRRMIIEQYEQQIKDQLGLPDFSFEDYNPDDYTAPISAVDQ